jgi:hypothetical protein
MIRQSQYYLIKRNQVLKTQIWLLLLILLKENIIQDNIINTSRVDDYELNNLYNRLEVIHTYFSRWCWVRTNELKEKVKSIEKSIKE